MLLKAKNMKRY